MKKLFVLLVVLVLFGCGGGNDTVTVEKKLEVEKLQFVNPRVELNVGEKVLYQIIYFPTLAEWEDSMLIMSTTDDEIAIVEEGIVKCVGPGVCQVIATYNPNIDLKVVEAVEITVLE